MLDHGRVDYRPRSRKWAVIVYQGSRDVLWSLHDSHSEAVDALRFYVDDLKTSA